MSPLMIRARSEGVSARKWEAGPMSVISATAEYGSNDEIESASKRMNFETLVMGADVIIFYFLSTCIDCRLSVASKI